MNASADTYQVSTQATNHPVLGVHDAFRHGPSSAAQKVASGNVSALQARLEKVSCVWELAAVCTSCERQGARCCVLNQTSRAAPVVV